MNIDKVHVLLWTPVCIFLLVLYYVVDRNELMVRFRGCLVFPVFFRFLIFCFMVVKTHDIILIVQKNVIYFHLNDLWLFQLLDKAKLYTNDTSKLRT